MNLISINKQIPIARQCDLLGISRSNYYYKPIGESEENLLLMRKIDELYLKHPYWGRPQMTLNLQKMGYKVNHKRISRLMKLMNIRSVLPKPNWSKPNSNHEIYPYLLSNVTIQAPNQVWSTDISYIPMECGFLYLVAVIDCFSRYVLSWEISNSMDTHFCITALENALKHGKPTIFNTDQGSQFTSKDFTDQLKSRQIQISMDGKGRAIDNVFVERLWWSVKTRRPHMKTYICMPIKQVKSCMKGLTATSDITIRKDYIVR